MPTRSRVARRSTRSALGNSELVRFTAAYFLATMAELGFFVGALVYAYDHGGVGVTGLSGVALLVPTAVAAAAAGAAAHRRQPAAVLLWAYVTQTIALAGAAVAAYANAPVAVVTGSCAVAAGAFTFVMPACAVLLPAIVRSARELTVANVWIGGCESASLLGSGALSTLLLALQGPALVLAGGAVLTSISTVTTLFHGSVATTPAGANDQAGHECGPTRLMLNSLTELRGRPGTAGVLAVAAGRYVLVGALDLVVVVLAVDQLGLGDSGPGLLATSVGLGALLNALASAMLVRRERLAPLLALAIGSIAVAFVVLGTAPTLAGALVLLPVAGFSGALVALTSQMLLQRSTPPHALGGVFGAIELFAGIGMVAGSLITQGSIAISGVRAALIGIGAFFTILLVLTWRSLRLADDSADIPIVAISLLRTLPAFAPLPPLELETVARAATELSVEAGQVVMTEGEEGDRFYAVADGSFDIVTAGRRVSTAVRGGCFGEVALLANVARTATVTANCPGSLLAIHRVPFLVAVTGSDSSRQAAWGVIRTMGLGSAFGDVPTLDP